MNRAQGKTRQRAFIGALVIPSAAWLLLSAVGATKVLDYDTGEKRVKHEISEDAGLGTITQEVDSWISDRVPFRSILLSINSGLDHVLEFPYNKLIEPLLLKHAGGKTVAEIPEGGNPQIPAGNAVNPSGEMDGAGNGYVQETPDAGYLPVKILGTGTEKALQGRNKWLFYANALDSYQGMDLPTEDEMDRTCTYLNDLHTICEEKGIQEISIFYPNKESVYDEYMPDIEKGETSRMLMLEKYAKEHYPDLPMDYIYDEMLEAKPTNLLYRKQDTHWTIQGALVGLNNMYRMLGLPEIDTASLKYKVVEEAHGDLYYLANLPESEYGPEQVEVCDYKEEIWDTVVNERNEGDTVWKVTSDIPDGKRLVVVGDSFMHAMMPVLGCDFSSVYFVNWKEIDEADWSMFEAADYLVVEAVERNCTNIEYALAQVNEHLGAKTQASEEQVSDEAVSDGTAKYGATADEAVHAESEAEDSSAEESVKEESAGDESVKTEEVKSGHVKNE